MKKLLVALLVLGSVSSFAQKYECGFVGGVDEYTIYVGLDEKVACFFDNDYCSNIPLIDVKFFESLPPQTVYIFEGPTNYGKTQIVFNLERLTASVTEGIGTDKEKTLTAQVACKENSDIEFDD